MKKHTNKTIRLRAETVRTLTGLDLRRAAGGIDVPLTHAAGCMTWGNGTDCDPPPIVGGGQ